MNCLDKIIGLSETVCPCFDEDKPSDYNESKSGIFLDQLEGFNIELAGAADDCARDGIWARMERAVRNAKFDYKNNLLGCIGTNYKPKIDTLNTQLAGSTFQGSAPINPMTTAYAGIKLTPMQIKGGVLIIKRLGLMINTTTAVTIKIFSNVPSNNSNSTLIYSSTPINLVADTFSWTALSTPLELPMWSYGTNVKYYIAYELDGSYIPKNNTKDCGCSGTARPYLQWMDFTGFTGNNINEPTSFTDTVSANGISIDLQIKCKTSEIICSDEYPLEFEDDGYALNMAYAIRFRAAAKLYEELLNTGVINRYTLLNREYVAQKIGEWNTEYMNWINYLCANASFDKNDCLICRTNQNSLVKTSINVVGDNFSWLHGGGFGY